MSRHDAPRVAVVTGGAQSIGQAIAERLAQDGHDVAIADIRAADETVELVRAHGRRGLAVECDVSSGESVVAMAQHVRNELGDVGILVANAGIYPILEWADTSWEDWRRVMSVNVDSLFHLCKAFIPGMAERRWGRVVAVSSTTFHMGTRPFAAYTTSKGAVIGFVRAVAGEVGEAGVTINSIAPSLVRTEGTRIGPHEALGWFEATRSLQAIKRDEVPADLVGAVSFFTSDDAAFITGQTLPVDGGLARA